jgi:hypothetical protein
VRSSGDNGAGGTGFLEALNLEQRQAALVPFASDERRNWHYIPRERRGVPLKAMTEMLSTPPRRCCAQLLASAVIQGVRAAAALPQMRGKRQGRPRSTWNSAAIEFRNRETWRGDSLGPG